MIYFSREVEVGWRIILWWCQDMMIDYSCTPSQTYLRIAQQCSDNISNFSVDSVFALCGVLWYCDHTYVYPHHKCCRAVEIIAFQWIILEEYILRYVGVSQQITLWNWKILTLLTFRSMARTHTLSQRHVSTCLLHSVEIQAQFHYNLISVFTHRVSYTLIHPVQ